MKAAYKKQIKELMYMRALDQEQRMGDSDPDNTESIDKNNTEKLKEIIDEIGWPTKSKVGHEASNSAWLLVQHADHDPAFQERCLELLTKAEDDVNKANVAYLTDRVRVNMGKPQVYGTQFKEEGGELVLEEVEDPENLDKRREQMGLQSMEEYEKIMQRIND